MKNYANFIKNLNEIVNGYITLVKIGENEYRVDGKFKYHVPKEKKVEVDGEIYTRTWQEPASYDCEESFKNKDDENNKSRWERREFDEFVELGLPIYYVWDDMYWVGIGRSGLLDEVSHCDSSSSYVQHIDALYQSNVIDHSVILDWHYGKRELAEINEHQGKVSIDIPLIPYGSGYYMSFEIPVDKFLEMDFSKFGPYLKSEMQTLIERKYNRGRFWNELSDSGKEAVNLIEKKWKNK